MLGRTPRILALTVLLLAGAPLISAADEPLEPDPAVVGALKAAGLSDKVAAELAEAAEVSVEDETVKPLLPFFDAADPQVRLAAAGLAVSMDPEAALREIRRRVESGRPDSEHLIFALTGDYSANAISYLADLNSRTSGQTAAAADFVLRVLTQTVPPEGQSWKDWWAENARTFEIPIPEDDAEQAVRLNRIAAAQSSEKVQSLLQKTGSGDKLLDRFSELLGELAAGLQRGADLRISELAERADRAFQRSDWAEAITAYRRAIDEAPVDDRSRFLLACLLLETGQTAEASVEFEKISTANPDITSAVFLRKLAKRREANPTERWDEAGLREFAAFSPKPEVGMAGWGDPIIADILAQASVGGGPFAGDHAEVYMLLAEAESAEETLGAIAWARPMERTKMLRAALEKHPDSAVVMAAYTSRALSSSAERDVVLETARRWAATEPDNALPALLILEAERSSVKDPTFSGSAADYDALLNHIEQALARPVLDDHWSERTAATEAARIKLQRPFGSFGSISEMRVAFLKTTAAISSGASQFLESGDLERARRGAECLLAWGAREEAAATRSLDKVFAQAKSAFGRQLLIKIARAAGREADAVAWENKQKEAKAALRDLADPSIVALLTLPVPSLSTALTRRFDENELELLRHWKTLTE